jgi:two-component system, OmpR family, alkaline phosphatase synthesis response regulator PhoP
MTKILVVEDDKFLDSAYRAKLTKTGFEVRIATDGNEALRTLQSFTPDIILLDLVMPGKDGFATLEEIKKSDKLKHIPVIVASNLGQKEDLDKALALGAVDYIIKSDLSLDALISKILETLQANKTAAA